jgi:hypothetical protein
LFFTSFAFGKKHLTCNLAKNLIGAPSTKIAFSKNTAEVLYVYHRMTLSLDPVFAML